jgi:hypothetical protein
MPTLKNPLIKKLAAVLLIKLAVLVVLWWGFVKDQRVTVDTNSVAVQFLQSAPIAAHGVPK